MVATVDTIELESKVKEMYRHVAQEPGGDYHFELGERLALRVGYDADRLRDVPAGAVESFAGVGFFFDLANLTSGETVVDLGSGSGMDALYAADHVGPAGRVVGIDFTLEQLEKARKIAAGVGADHVEFLEGRIESLPLPDASVDCVISNGVINLAATLGIAAATGSACHEGLDEPSPVLSAMGQPPERALAALRFSLGRWTTVVEIDEAAQQIAAGVARLART